jgi:hypothetical protein
LEKKNAKIRVKILIYSILSVLVVMIACNQEKQEEVYYGNKRLRDVIVSYMSEPMFRNKDFVQQVTGTEADLKLFDADEMTLYFAINKRDFDSSKTLELICYDPGLVEFGFENNGDVFLGAYTLKGTERFLFRLPKNDFKVDSSVNIKVMRGNLEYMITPSELAGFADDISVYGGSRDMESGGDKYMANHGAFVARGNEPSLLRLTKKITGDETDKQRIAQMPLDFVTGGIKFNTDEAYGGYEIMKRPNEPLLSGNADCSGMTILYASLLEQAGIDYRLVYFTGHIAVAVEGDFSNDNGLVMKIEGKKYSLAETTVNGFVMGNTRLLKSDITSEIRYVQKPGRDSVFVKYTGR